MRTHFQAIRIGLCALALWAGGAARVAADQITDIAMVPRLTIEGTIGATNQIQYTNNLSQGNWAVLTNVLVTQSPYYLVDVTAPPAPQRFYRVVVTVPTAMVFIPAGSFTMGNCMDPGEGSSEELPLHTVYVSGFYMDTNLVTSNLWLTVKGWNGGNGYSYDNVGSGKDSGHPVQTVNWYDVVKWCNARSQMESLTPCYYTDSDLMAVYKTGQVAPYVNWSANGYRLPTEAEWEKAARGGASGHRFPWSDTDNITHSRANYNSSSSYDYDTSPTRGYHPTFNDGFSPYTSPVGYFAPNGYGLYDMAGNVWEWCWDWWDYSWYSNPEATQNDTRGPASSPYELRVSRGGSWSFYASSGSRCAYRIKASPEGVGDDIGFRCVRGL